MESQKVRVIVREAHVKKGSIELVSEKTNTRVRLRKFQEELVFSFCQDADRFIGVEAPTGAGKTFTLLAPFIANIICEKNYQGVVGVYPTKPLVNDQFLSLGNILDSIGERIGPSQDIKEIESSETAIKYRVKLRIAHNGIERTVESTIGLVKLTREALDKLREYLKQHKGEMHKNSLLDIIRKKLIDAEYLIAIAVPEYPYMMLSSVYRSRADSYKILDLALDSDFVYRIVKRIASAESKQELDNAVLSAKDYLKEALSKEHERNRQNIYSALFSEIIFLDEFHIWTIYERPTVIALILLHYLESLRSARPSNYKVVFSSATPQDEIYSIIKDLGIGEAKVIRAEVVRSGFDTEKIKSKAIVDFVPVRTNPTTGVKAWFRIEEFIPKIIEMYKDVIVASSRAILFARRDAVVEEAAMLFNTITNKTPAVVMGIKTVFPGKEILEEKKSDGELFVFGNYSIEIGVDLRAIRFGLVYGISVGEIVQRIGRIGRGDVEEAHVVIPVPQGYTETIKLSIDKAGGEVDYTAFINILSEVMPQRLGIDLYGTDFIMKHKVGKIRIYAPLATYILTQIFMWEYHEELQKLCREFMKFLEKLRIVDIFDWLDNVSKTPEVLIPLTSFRISYTVPYIRTVKKSPEKTEKIEDSASLSTLLGNYDVEYAEGKIFIKGISKKSLLEIFSLHCSYSPKGLYDTIIPSDFLLHILGKAVKGNNILIGILKNISAPLYVAPPGMDAEIFVAYGYAIVFELPNGRQFYAFIL